MLQSLVPESSNTLILVLREGELLSSYAGFSTGKLQSLLEVNPAVKLYTNDTCSCTFTKLVFNDTRQKSKTR